MNIIFAGSAQFSIPSLSKLLACDHQLLAVYTQPDRPFGRGQKLAPTAVKQLAQEHAIPAYTPASLKTAEALATLRELKPDIIVVIAYGQLIPEPILALPRYGCINLHPSLLPSWRGATPIQHSILSGETQTGITVMQLDAGMDSGPIIQQIKLDILPQETSGQLHDRMADLGADLILSTLNQLTDNSVTLTAQNHTQATYTRKIKKQDARIIWTQPAATIANQIRAYNPWPISFTTFKQNTMRIWRAEALTQQTDLKPGTISVINKQQLEVATGDGTLRLLEIQLAGKKRHLAQDFINAQAKHLTGGTACLE